MEKESIKVKISNKIVEFHYILSKYMYPYLNLYFYKHKLLGQHVKDFVSIPLSLEDDFIKMLENELEHLLKEGYIPPTHKNKSKYSSRYQKIEFKGKVYDVNYATDFVGTTSYGLFQVIKKIKQNE